MAERHPVATAVEAIAKAAGHSVLGQEQLAVWPHVQGTDVAVFSYARDFPLLWGHGTGQGGFSAIGEALRARAPSSPLTVVVIWDRIPQDDVGPVDTARYLTAIDWVVGVSLMLEEHVPNNDPYLRIRLLILDLASHEVSHADSVRFASLFPKRDITAMPWVRLFRPVTSGGRDWEASEFIAEIYENRWQGSSKRDDAKERSRDLSSLRRIWQANLTHPSKADDRHSIANLVGAQLLLEGMGVSGAGQGTNTMALVELMRAADLVPHAPDREPGTWYGPKHWDSLIESFVLLDDMADKGWTDFLRAALGLTNGYAERLRAFTDPQSAIQAKAISLSPKEARRDLLFLDLRLFAPTGNQKERDFLREVLDAYSHFMSQPRARTSWQDIDETEIAAINRYISGNATQETADYHAALTLFPRLVALANPWMPIVIFSSTGQKHIIDRLQPYGNIILEFDKPRFFGQATDAVVAETKRRFARAMERAVAIARGRQVCNEIVEQRTRFGEHSSRLGAHVEIYLDESGSGPDIRVGGIAAIYPDKNTCLKFWQTLQDNDLVWGYHRDDPWTAPHGRYLRKATQTHPRGRRTQIYDVLRRIGERALEHSITIAAFSLGPLKKAPGSLPEAIAPDFYFRSLLRYLLEILLCDWLRKYAHDSAVAIYAGTRVVSDEDFKYGPAEFLRLQQDFNLNMSLDRYTKESTYFEEVPYDEVTRNWATLWSQIAFLTDRRAVQLRNQQHTGHGKEVLSFLFSYDDLYPVVLEILGQRPSAPRNSVAALGVQLVYDKRSHKAMPHQLPRQLHYAADYVISCPDSVPQEWWERGFIDQAGPQFASLLNTSRYADDPNDVVEAVVEWRRSCPSQHGTNSCGRFIGNRLNDRIVMDDCLTAERFIQLCDALALAGC